MGKRSMFIAIIALLLFAGNSSEAAYPVRKAAIANSVIISNGPGETVANTTQPSIHKPAHAAKSHSLLNRLIHKAGNSSEISQTAYIVLAIFVLGWLAIGLNDDFEGSSWLISLLLYCLVYLPGLIYTLIVMDDYY